MENVTFFMLLTNRDCLMADCAIKSYSKLWDKKRKFGYGDFILFVYCNCLSNTNKEKYIVKWKQFPYVSLFDNEEKIAAAGTAFQPGQIIVSPEGILRKRDDFAESYDELWTTELKNFKTPYIVTADADFEILNPDFYFHLMDEIESNPFFIAASTNYDETRLVFDTYSNRNILLHERSHTWFCIYKREAFDKSNVSHFYYEENNDGMIHAYDSAALFQSRLREKGFGFYTLPKSYCNSFIHYGAGSKNKSLTEKNFKFYRAASILTECGLLHRKSSRYLYKLNQIVKTICVKTIGKYLSKYKVERNKYIWD